VTSTPHKWRSGPRWTKEEEESYFRACGFELAGAGHGCNEGRFVCISCGSPCDESRAVLFGRRAHKAHNNCRSRWCISASSAERYHGILERAGFSPLEVYTRSTAPMLCRCRKCGEGVRVNPSKVRAGTYECPGCSGRRGGYDARRAGYVYFVRNERLRAWQVGVTNYPERRVREHERHGWQLLELLSFEDGAEALRFERWTIRRWRSAGYPEGVAAGEMPQNGWTETVAIVNVPNLDPAHLLAEFRSDR